MFPAIAFSGMTARSGEKGIAFTVPEDLHEAFLRHCFLATPRTTMKQEFIAFMAKKTGLPVPEFVDGRKTRSRETVVSKPSRPAKPPRR